MLTSRLKPINIDGLGKARNIADQPNIKSLKTSFGKKTHLINSDQLLLEEEKAISLKYDEIANYFINKNYKAV